MVFENVLDMVSRERGELKKSWHVEWFYGNDLKNYWLKFNNSGIGTFAMVDEINEGFSILTDSIINANNQISFGNTKHYDSQACELIQIGRRVTANSGVIFGFTDEPFGRLGSTINNQLSLINNTNNTNQFFLHNNGSPPNSVIDTGLPIDTNFTKYKFQGNSTFAQLFVNGTLRATATTDLPTGSVQPAMQVQANTVTPGEGRISYQEIYNT